MPHIIIEYGKDGVSDAQVTSLLDVLHQAIVATSIFDASHIRLRAKAYSHYRVGGEKKPFIHVQCRIHAGRDEVTKQQLTASILQTLKAHAWDAVTKTVEVVELERASYAKYVAP